VAADKKNKAPRRKQRGINYANLTLAFSQLSPQGGGELNP